MGGLTTPKGGDTKQTTTTNTAPQYIQDANQNLVNLAGSTLGQYITQPAYTTAGVNADQSGAYDLTRGLAQGAFTGAPIGVPANGGMSPYSMSYAPASMGAAATYAPASVGNARTYGAASVGNAAQMNAAQVNGADIQKLLNPYIQSVIDPARAQLRQSHDATSAQIGAQSAAAGSYGGSREGLRQAQNDRALGEQTSSLVSQLMSAGYDKATATALSNAQMRQSADATNMAARNQFTMTDAAALNNAAQFNTAAQNQFTMTDANALNTAAQYNSSAQDAQHRFDAGALTQAGATNAAAQNSRDQFLASLGMSSATLNDALASNDQNRKLQAIQALLGIGNQQQQLEQSSLNVPLQYLQLLSGVTPKDNSGTATQVAPNTANSPLMNLFGLGTSILGMGTGGGNTVLGGLLK